MKRLILALLLLLTCMAQAQNKNYITRVFDYLPAPGQFVNVEPAFNVGEPRDSVLVRVLQRLGPSVEMLIDYDDNDNPFVVDTIVKPVTSELISLGSFGGYVTFAFDHPVVNIKGEYDFQIFGNASGSDNLAVSGGSSEPGIVMVGIDKDGNGVPSNGDLWYELAGSDYDKPKTQKNFSITYYKPDEGKERVPDPKNRYLNDIEYIHWTCNSTDSLTEGYVFRNTFHNQSYWPQWITDDTLTFTGTKLACNAEDVGQNGQYYFVQYFLDWGYVDNRKDYDWEGDYEQAVHNKMNMGFNLDWAVDANGNPVNLTKVDFIKVYSGLLQYCGWLGETSTEVKGAIDLHPDAPIPEEPVVVGDVTGDGLVDVSDVNAVINMMLGKTEQTPAADITGDGQVDVSDVNAIINIMLGKY